MNANEQGANELRANGWLRASLRALLSVSLQLSTALPFNEGLNLLVETALEILPGEAAHIYLYYSEKQPDDQLELAAALWRDGRGDSLPEAQHPDGLAARVARSGEARLAAEPHAEPLFAIQVPGHGEIRALAGFPLARGAHTLGVLTVAFSAPYQVSEDEQTLMKLLAAQAAAAIENTRLLQTERRRADELNTIFELSRQITHTLNLEEVFQAAHKAISRLMPNEAFYITLRDRQTGETVASYLLDKGVRYPPVRTSSELGLSSYVIRTGESILIRDVEAEPMPFIPTHYGDKEHVRSLVAVPLQFSQQTIGMLSTQSYRPQAFDEHDLSMLQSIADHVAIAVENAYLFTDLQKRYQELQALDQRRTELIQNVSHDLRNPLAFIKTYIELMLQNEMGPLTEQQRQGLVLAQAKTGTIVRLVEDITFLEIEDPSWLRPQPISLPGLARNALDTVLEEAQEQGVTLVLEAPQDFPVLNADPERIAQVLDNLLGNALKYCFPDSKIVVRLEATPELALISVADQGEGIPEQDLGRIFDRFYRARNASFHRYTGRGLGLPIVKHIVEMHGGKVWVESQMGVGSTFYFTLPLPAPQPGPTVDQEG